MGMFTKRGLFFIVCLLLIILGSFIYAASEYPPTDIFSAMTYFPLNETSGTHVPAVIGNDGSAPNNEASDWKPAYLNNGLEMNFDDNDEMIYSNFTFYKKDPVAFSFWINTTQAPAFKAIIGYTGADAYPPNFYIAAVSSGAIALEIGTTGSDSTNTNIKFLNAFTQINDGKWHHIVLNKRVGFGKSNDTDLWIDGINWTNRHVDRQNASSNASTREITFAGRNTLLGSDRIDATFDEILIFNRALTAEDILTLNNTNYTAADTTPPTISDFSSNATVTAPTYNERYNVSFACSDEIAVSCSWYQMRNSTGSINSTPDCSTPEIYYEDVQNIHKRGETVYLKPYCNDSSNNEATDAEIDFTVANTAPQIESLLPADNYHSNVNLSVNFTYTDVDSDVGECSFYVNNTLNETQSNIADSTLVFFSKDFTADGHYGWNVTCTDSYDPVSVERLFVLDTINPIITWVNPSSANTTISNQDLALDLNCVNANLFQFNITVLDSLGSEVFFKPRNATGTALNINDVIPLTIEDNYTVIAKCSDQVNSAETHVLYQYEITAPTYADDATNGSASTRTGEDVQFNVTWSDAHPSHYVFCFGDGTDCVNESGVAYVSGEKITLTKTISAVHNEEVKWQFYANDTAGNWNNTPLASFTIANTVPTAPTLIEYTSPATAYTDSMLTCSASGSTDADSETITYYYEFKDSDDNTILQAFSTNDSFDCNIAGCERSDTIYCHAKANDGFEDSAEGTAATIIIQNYLPTHDNPLLTAGTDYTNETLICTNQNTYDADGDSVINIYHWYKDSSPLNSLYLPFEINVNDYSGNGNTVTDYSSASATGKTGQGREFNGTNYLKVTDDNSIDFTDEKSWEIWFKRDGTGEETLFDKSNGNGSNYQLRLNSDDKLEFSYIITGVDGGDFTWETKTEANFNEGNYSNTEWSTDHVKLSSSQSLGTYTSKIFDASAISSWNNISWTEEVPYQEELPDNKAIETVLGGADMTGNVLLMHLDENIDGAGYIMEDTSGSGNNGTSAGFLNCTVGGKFDKGCFSWSTGGHIEVDDDASLKPSSITISLWANFNSLTNDRDLVSKIGSTDGQMGYVLYYSDTNDNIQFFIEIGTTNYNLLSNFNPTVGEWNLYTATYDGETQRIYVNGIEANSNSAPSGAMSHNNLDLHIGNRPDNSNNFNGYIDEVVIWNRGLSAFEILNIYKRGILNLNLSVRSCDDSNCDDDPWSETYTSSPQDLSVANNTYFQFKADFFTENVSYSPELDNVSVTYSRDGIAAQTISLTSDTTFDTNWHYAAVTFGTGANNFKMYVDGSLDNNKTETVLPQYRDNDLFIGRNSSESSYFDGVLDEFRIYAHALSSEQVSNNYNLDYNQIVSAETTRSENYICSIVPNDGIGDGIAKNSSTLTILNYVPSPVPTLSNPADDYSSGVLPEFNWTASTDSLDNDPISYIIQTDNNSDFSSVDYTNTVSEARDTAVSLDSWRIDNYWWRVLATDGIGNSSWSSIRNFTYAKWEITFNVQSGEFDIGELNSVNITNCNYTGFIFDEDTTNTYGPYGFPPGDLECTFERVNYYDLNQTFTADSDKTIEVTMSLIGTLTDEEHTWLEAIYNCVILKDCDMYNLLLEINQTVGNVWEHTQPTDENVVTSETITNKIVNSTHNLTIDYTVGIPIKAGYGLGDYLPVRIGYWFLNTANTSCHNQGDRPTGVADPYCQPLIIETIGPMGGSVSFTVELQPSLPAGDYSIKRIIDIDPNDEWINYGQEEIDTITVTEDTANYGVSLERIGEEIPETGSDSPSRGSSGGGGGGGSSSSVTKIYQNITYIINQPETKEKSKEETKEDKEGELKDIWKYPTTGLKGAKLKDSSGLAGITGAVTGAFSDNLPGTPLLMVVLVTIIVGLIGYIYGSKKK